MSVESDSRQWMDMQGYIFCALEGTEDLLRPARTSWLLGRLPWTRNFYRVPGQKPNYISPEGKLSWLGPTAEQIMTVRAPFIQSKPWTKMMPIYEPDLYNPRAAWKAVLEPMGLYSQVEQEIDEFYAAVDPFKDPHLSADATDQERGAQLAGYFNSSFNDYELPVENELAIRVMKRKGKKLHLISSFVTYKLPSLLYAFSTRYRLWGELCHSPVTGFMRLGDDIPVTFYKLFAARVALEMVKAIDPTELQEIGEDDRLNAQWQAAINGVRVLLNDADKRDLGQSPLMEQTPVSKLLMSPHDEQVMKGFIIDNMGLDRQAGIDNKAIKKNQKEWANRLKVLIP